MNRRHFLGCAVAVPLATIMHVEPVPAPLRKDFLVRGITGLPANRWYEYQRLDRQVDVWIAMTHPVPVGDLVTIGDDLRPLRVISWTHADPPAGDGLYHVHLRRQLRPVYVEVGI